MQPNYLIITTYRYRPPLYRLRLDPALLTVDLSGAPYTLDYYNRLRVMVLPLPERDWEHLPISRLYLQEGEHTIYLSDQDYDGLGARRRRAVCKYTKTDPAWIRHFEDMHLQYCVYIVGFSHTQR